MEEQHETFPNVFEAALLIALLIVIEIFVWAAVADSGAFAGADGGDVASFITVVGNGILFIGLMAYKRIGYRTLFHPSRNSVASTLITLAPPIVMLAPGLVLAAGALNAVVLAFFPMSAEEIAYFSGMTETGVVPVIASCIIAPLLEELAFRGVILRSFLLQYSRTKAILLSSLLFGIAHMNIYQLAAAFSIGIVAGWLYERCRSLWPCIVLHATYNTCVVWFSAHRDIEDNMGRTTIAAFGLAIVGGLILLKLLGSFGKPLRGT